MSIEVIDFNSDEIKGQYEKYSGKENQIDRIALIILDPKAFIVSAQVHFKERPFLCKKGKCCEILGLPKWRFGAVIIKYDTDSQGNLKKPFGYKLYPWLFNESKYLKLKLINKETPLSNHDLKVTCTNEKYQHLDFVVCSNECYWTDPRIKNQVLSQAKPVFEHLKRIIASDLSTEEINDILHVPISINDPSTNVSLDSILNKS